VHTTLLHRCAISPRALSRPRRPRPDDLRESDAAIAVARRHTTTVATNTIVTTATTVTTITAIASTVATAIFPTAPLLLPLRTRTRPAA
jgi:hypothetical protein